MPTVWVRQDPVHRTRFHSNPDCRHLRKRPARGEGNPLVAMDLNDVHYRPCATCYPDAPRINIRKAYCTICESRYACMHNGGVQVINRRGWKYWVWPDANQMPYYRRTS